jgi:hypothetical protein
MNFYGDDFNCHLPNGSFYFSKRYNHFMKIRKFVIAALPVLFFLGLIPIFLAIIPPSRSIRVIPLLSPMLATGGTAIPDAEIRINEPIYLRNGINEYLKIEIVSIQKSNMITEKSTEFIFDPLVPSLDIEPQGKIQIIHSPEKISSLTWDLVSKIKIVSEGTIWTYVKDISATNAATIPVLAIPMIFRTQSFLNLPLDLAAFWGGVWCFVILIANLLCLFFLRNSSKNSP